MTFFTENGIETLDDLDGLSEDDINLFGFNIGEKKRVKTLPSIIHQPTLGIYK